MEQAQRANAAQLAARKIRDKPRPRRTGSQTPTPTTQQQLGTIQTQAPSQNGGGGLFGGSIQATGEFNFSAPAQGLSLPPSSFGLRSNTMNTPSQDASENDGRFAGDDRATKRQFGSASTIQQSNSPFQISNSFGQSQPSNLFGSTQQPSGGSMFPFGAPQQSGSAGTSFNAGSNTASTKNPFAFQPTSQPPPNTPTSSFGTGPFNFNQQPSQTPGPFGSAPAAQQDKPANSPFSFGQTSGQPSSSSTIFSTNPAPTVPISNLFGSAPTTTTTSPLSNFFGTNTATAPAAPNNSLFGSTASAVPPASSLSGTPKAATTQDKSTSSPFFFGQAATTPSSSGTTFSSTPATSAPTSNFFGASQSKAPAEPIKSSGTTMQQAAPSSNPFAHLNLPAASPISNVFGRQDQKTAAPATSNPFGMPNASPSSKATNFFGNPASYPATPNKPTLFGQLQPQPSPGSSVFESLKKPIGSTTDASTQNQQASASSVFGNVETKVSDDLLGNLNKPVDQSITQPKVNGNLSENGENLQPSLFSKPSSAANLFSAPKTAFTASPTTNDSKPISASAQIPLANGNLFSSTKPLDAPASASQPPSSGMFPNLEQVNSAPKFSGSPVARSTVAASTTSESVQGGELRIHVASARQQMKDASEMTVESMEPFMPPNYTGFQKMAFHRGYRMRAMNKAMSTFFASINPDEDATPIVEFYMEQREAVLGDTAALKRKTGEYTDRADHPSKRSKQSVEITSAEPREQQIKRKLNAEDQENENPNKRTRQIESSTAARGLANGEVKPNGQASAPVNGNNFQAWQTPTPGVSSSSDAPLKRKAGDQITKDTIQRNPLRPVRTPVTNGTFESNPSGSSTSNLIKNILDSPSKSLGNSSPERKMAALPETTKDNAPRTNAFANLPGALSPVKSTTTPPSTIFGSKATSKTPPASSQNVFASSGAPGALNAFTPKLATSNAVAGIISMDQKPSVLKAPVFGNVTVDFQSQFLHKAEEEALKKAIEDDYDSDDDLEEFKAKWKAERLEKKKAIEESAKNAKRFTFVPSASASSTGEESNQANIVATQPSAFSSSLFGQNPSSQASNSISNSSNSSRTPTPAFGSSTGSVLDGHTPGKPIKLEGIFGHLTDTSGKDDDADDESGDEASEPEVDSEKKDPTYQPEGESASGPGTPAEETGAGLASAKKTNSFASKFGSVSPSGSSTPTGGHTGGLFDRITKVSNVSGTSTPDGALTGGLFGRITKDTNTNVARGKYDDDDKEKENTQPSTANPFAALRNPFQNNAVAPSDHTWKNDSPIRFGSATPSKDDQHSTPTVSVTAATPTKIGTPASIFSELNKSTGAAPKPFSNLFGNIGGESKPAAPTSSMFGNLATGSASSSVGFVFGAPSATSSLFPSAAVSASTSRATTPGGTTDGDNSGDGEAEQEEHVPFNLSTGGPGEEHEDVIHEVRAKALKYIQKEGGGNSQGWESKGVGPLRVLKHKETGVSRILLRMDPTGLVILNKGILSGVNYESKEKTVKFLTALDKGPGLETWILQVKTPEMAKALAEVLEANKPI
ncbi:hypothetical protein N431DRAFT_370520 [Stipitochalara longipes BDJ]|nr:hypothetical protein N431DRAFT_370520 [Stipitochalara longipes BDJ]